MNLFLRAALVVVSLALPFSLDKQDQSQAIESVDSIVVPSATGTDENPLPEYDPDIEHLATAASESTTAAGDNLFAADWPRWLGPLLFLIGVLLLLGWLHLWLVSLAKSQEAAAKSRQQGEAPSKPDRVDVHLGPVFQKPPQRIDNLTLVDGIDAQAEKKLNAAGIYQRSQLSEMSATQLAALRSRFDLPKLKLESTKLESTKIDSTNPASKPVSFRGQRADMSHASATKTDPDLGIVYAAAPAEKDDLTQLAGIDAETAAELNAAGIYRFEQLNGMNTNQQSALKRRFDLGSLNFGSWHIKSATRSAAAVAATGSSSAVGGATTTGASTSSATSNRASNTNSGGALDATAATAGRHGADHSGPGTSSGNGTTGYRTSADTGVDSELGVMIYKSKPDQTDDLTKLAGIDAAAQKRLNAAGIYRFDQLSSLSEQQTAALAYRFDLAGADSADWSRCFYAWGRGIATTAESDEVYEQGQLHGIQLSQIADGVFDGEKLVAYPEQVIFRGSNPEGWGRGSCDEIDGVETALSCDSIRSDINYLRIRRFDTRESVVVPLTKGQIFANGDSRDNGWNGSSETFFGGRHIGAFAQHLPQEVETKFSQGGWGFGHRYDHNDRQEWGWGGRVIEPTTFEISVGCIGDAPGTVIFRGSDPSIWNTTSRDHEMRFADPVTSVSHPVNFVRIMRNATGEAVIVRVDGNHLLDEGFDPRCGWNGSGSEFSGGMHLGVYHSDLPQEFETRFEFGGWGFGHPYDDNDRQAWGWAGRQLPETVFEISVLDSVPIYLQHELVE